ncbi:MAG: type I restriction enzyme HsdR N-terminal domain-containing protein [Bacteroidota bacterium]
MMKDKQWVFPEYELRIQEKEGQQYIWDVLRKKWVLKQPEEWVRQKLIHHLMEDRKIPAGLLSIEKEIVYHGLPKRMDLVIYNRSARPEALIECKAPEVSFTPKKIQEVLLQISRYNDILHAPHLIITNGWQWACFSLNEKGNYRFCPSGWYEAD